MSTRIVDLFAGAGGWEEGLRSLGSYDSVGIESDPVACRTAEAAGHRRLAADIATTEPWGFGELWGLIGSPPCQAYSLAGKGLGRIDQERVVACARDLAAGRDTRAEHAHGCRDVRSLLTWSRCAGRWRCDRRGSLWSRCRRCMSDFTGAHSWYGFLSDSGSAGSVLSSQEAFVHDRRGDAGIIGPISENTDWRLIIEPRPWVYIRELGDTRRATQYRIRSVDFSHQGEYLCTSGERTGGHCGELKELRVGSQDYGQVHMCGVKEGDSGAPVVRWGSARGIQVQGVSNILHEDLCKVNFQSAHIAEDLLDVAIMTRNP